eukprot:CAMPEP_0183834064 /NCGR_PEP_ID=MMETSP0807_2-20130328/6399_1 /TAXON_ID=88271 /ORGANISM="Picocystis salinarum, Strain CCMP1897" /LENGTH=191 /DNA_ID=CAMNT_0026080049 /DNA_START=1685 /DNA_END=2260 /DNA_ORIENTATION=+
MSLRSTPRRLAPTLRSATRVARRPAFVSAAVSTSSLGDFTAVDIDGKTRNLSEFVGKVSLVVNVALNEALTDQNYKELVTLYNTYKTKGFEVLAFPCNQFGKQEPGTEEEIKRFAAKYGANFTMFSKIDVNGPSTHPLYVWLKDNLSGFMGSKDIKWNFGKFLLDKDGKPVKRYAPTDNPLSIVPDIEKLL